MKKTISIILCVIILFTFSGCSNRLSPTTIHKIKTSMSYYNQKAIDNIESLIGRNTDEAEDWIYETFSEDEIKKATVQNEGADPAYLSEDETVKIFFILEEGNNRLFIEPNDDKYDLIEEARSFINTKYLNTVKNYCESENPDYKNAPTICELALYNFDKADSSTSLNYFYLFNDANTWGWIGDTGPFASASFVWDNDKFISE